MDRRGYAMRNKSDVLTITKPSLHADEEGKKDKTNETTRICGPERKCRPRGKRRPKAM